MQRPNPRWLHKVPTVQRQKEAAVVAVVAVLLCRQRCHLDVHCGSSSTRRTTLSAPPRLPRPLPLLRPRLQQHHRRRLHRRHLFHPQRHLARGGADSADPRRARSRTRRRPNLPKLANHDHFIAGTRLGTHLGMTFCRHAHTHTRTHAHTRAQTHTRTHANTHTHTHTLSLSLSLSHSLSLSFFHGWGSSVE